MGGGGSNEQEVVEYYASIHYGVATKVDSFRSVHYGEKLLWKGHFTENREISIKKRGLFGGDKVEGGFEGNLLFMLGEDDQLMPPHVWQAMHRNEAFGSLVLDEGDNPEELRKKAPAYRGLATLFITERQDKASEIVSEIKKVGWGGASIGHNTAYIKDWWIRVNRAPKNCPFNATIKIDDRNHANPAAIIWECMTDQEWGMGYPTSAMDTASFTYAADYLADEGFGLSFLWNTQDTIEGFVGTVIDHIEASLVLDPYTGLFRLILIRADYDVDTLPILTPENCTLKNFDRKLWGETMNEISVAWTNPVNEKEETVTVQNLGNILMQNGEVVSETRTYEGVRTAELALTLAQRDLNTASSLLASAEVEVNRTMWRVLPGDVVKLQWPRGSIIEETVMRVGAIDHGKPGSSTITINMVEDVFGTPQEIFSSSSGSAWKDPRTEPTPMPEVEIFTPPFYFLMRSLGLPTALALPDMLVYDAILATHGDQGVSSYDILEESVQPNGDVETSVVDFSSPAGWATLAEDLPAAVESVVSSVEDMMTGGAATANSFAWIGGFEDEGEIALVTSIDASGYTLARGMLDTVPKEWPAGTVVWFSGVERIGSTGIERLAGETVDVKLLPVSSGGRLEEEDAPLEKGIMNNRPHMPLRPANVRLDGELFPDSEEAVEFPRTLTWAHRNAEVEDSKLYKWDEGSTQPPAGLEYRVIVKTLDASGTVTSTVSSSLLDSATTSYEITEEAIVAADPAAAYVRVILGSEIEGEESWQSITVDMRGPFRKPVDLRASYRAPTAPTNMNLSVVR